MTRSDADICRLAISVIDNTALNDNDTTETMDGLAAAFQGPEPHPAVVCVYPKFIKYFKKEYPTIKVATVTNFPLGQDPLQKVIEDTRQAVNDGADEVDIVIDYKRLIAEKTAEPIVSLVKAIRAVCVAPVALKVIIESGELKDPKLITLATRASLDGGADFVKTSTGKVPVNATLEAGAIMMSAIASWKAEHPERTGIIGFKAAGGIKTFEQARDFLNLAESLLGPINKDNFRFGASSLLSNLKKKLAECLEQIYGMTKLPEEAAKNAVFVDSQPVEDNATIVKGETWQIDKPPELLSILNSYSTSGFQATEMGRAIEEIRRMIEWRPTDEDIQNDVMDKSTRCTIWLSFTSNMISSGLREVFVFLAKHKLVDAFVTSAGGVEEDFIKCLAPTYLGDFHLKGKVLRSKGWNRIGNLIVPNNNYCLFEDWLQPILDTCLKKQQEENVLWTPSKLISELGKEINDESSLYYWCFKNNIPVFCPGLTDGSLGDNLYFHSYRNPGLIIDVIQDIRLINDMAVKAKKSGIIILGGGIAKHHTCNANLMRNGADFAVYVSTAQEFDGSDSGARPDEAISWGKIRCNASPVKVNCDATIAFPLIMAATFCRYSRI